MQAIEFAEVVSVRGISMRKLDDKDVIRLLRLEVERAEASLPGRERMALTALCSTGFWLARAADQRHRQGDQALQRLFVGG